MTSQDRVWRVVSILPASETGGKASLAEVPIPFPVCSVAGDWKTLCNNVQPLCRKASFQDCLTPSLALS